MASNSVLSTEYSALFHAAATRFVFGSVEEQVASAVGDAERVLVATGETIATKTDLLERVRRALGAKYAGAFTGVKEHTPTSCVLAGAAAAREVRADALVSLGGSSAVDAVKGIALVLAEGENFEHLKPQFDPRTGRTQTPELPNPKLPHVAIPTTLSAAETTAVIGITDDATRHKTQYVDPKLALRAIVYDPAFTLATPRTLWLSTGMKALDSAIEKVWSRLHDPFCDALGLHSIRLLVGNLARSAERPEDLEARANLLAAAALTGFGPSRSGLSSAIRHALGGLAGVPHGYCPTTMLAHVMEYNNEVAPERLRLIARAMGLDTALPPGPAGQAAADRVRALVRELELPNRLRDVGVREAQLPAIAEDAYGDIPIARNPRRVESPAEILALLRAAW